MGRYEDKIAKNVGKAKAVWYAIRDKKSRGILRYIEEEGIVEVAKPIGVIGAVTPTTNPTTTPMHNSMIALKGGNSIIISPHPRAKKAGKLMVDLMNKALAEIGAPENLIQIVEEPTVEISGLIMKMTDVCISTGGPGMVKAAYSSGKPAFGVGAGNCQCLIDRGADLVDAIPKIIRGRTYDNGILCTCEQTIHCPKEDYDTIIRMLQEQGAYYVGNPDEIARLREAAFPGGVLNKAFVGASPAFIAEAAGLKIPENTKLLVVKLEKDASAEPLAREKMFPVLGAFAYDTWEDAVRMAAANLEVEGKGHSVVIHSFQKDHIEYAAENICVSRFSINQIGSSSLGGSFTNGLNPTSTLGCGSWGNNSLSENLWFTHLINVSRIAYEVPKHVPTDEEIWA